MQTVFLFYQNLTPAKNASTFDKIPVNDKPANISTNIHIRMTMITLKITRYWMTIRTSRRKKAMPKLLLPNLRLLLQFKQIHQLHQRKQEQNRKNRVSFSALWGYFLQCFSLCCRFGKVCIVSD